jgi:hypothetical protein
VGIGHVAVGHCVARLAATAQLKRIGLVANDV